MRFFGLSSFVPAQSGWGWSAGGGCRLGRSVPPSCTSCTSSRHGPLLLPAHLLPAATPALRVFLGVPGVVVRVVAILPLLLVFLLLLQVHVLVRLLPDDDHAGLSAQVVDLVGQTHGVFVEHVAHALDHAELDAVVVPGRAARVLTCPVVTHLDGLNVVVQQDQLLARLLKLGVRVVNIGVQVRVLVVGRGRRQVNILHGHADAARIISPPRRHLI